MRLYHATTADNFDNIEYSGTIEALKSEKISHDEQLDGEFVYGFDNIKDAFFFLVYDNNTKMEDVVILAFEADDAIKDSEYDGNAFAVDHDVTGYTVVKRAI